MKQKRSCCFNVGRAQYGLVIQWFVQDAFWQAITTTAAAATATATAAAATATATTTTPTTTTTTTTTTSYNYYYYNYNYTMRKETNKLTMFNEEYLNYKWHQAVHLGGGVVSGFCSINLPYLTPRHYKEVGQDPKWNDYKVHHL